MKLRWFGATLAALLLLSAPAAAGEGATVDQIELGTHVYGERVGPEDLAGRFVVVFFWDLG